MNRLTLLVIALGLAALLGLPARAHEGHDHDKPPALNLPVAPRVVAVTPDFELVGVASGKGRLTIFLHSFATNEPVKGARMTVSAGNNTAEAEAMGDGVFTIAAPWIAAVDSVDLVFALTLRDGAQDLLTGQLQSLTAAAPVLAPKSASARAMARLKEQPEMIAVGVGGLMTGVLLTLLLARPRNRQGTETGAATPESVPPGVDRVVPAPVSGVTSMRRGVGAAAMLGALCLLSNADAARAQTSVAGKPDLPSVPATMATDLAQRMPDGTLFVPKATQHLLSMRTLLTAAGSAPRSAELTGTIIAGPEHFGRVQPGRPGRIEAAPGGLAYIGKRVEKGELLAYVKTYIEAADRANMDSLIAETEARIAKTRTILSRYEKSPASLPQVKIDEVRGELDALTRKRAELLPSAGSLEPILAPISGIISVASATIGQIVESRDVLFEIVDPSQFWVEAIAHDPDVARNLEKAYAVANRGGQIALAFAGRGLALRQQAAILSFRVTSQQDGLSIGMPVKVVLQSTTTVDGFVLPASAIVRGPTGLPIVWIKTEAERFEPQIVKTEPLDGVSVVVTSGLKVDQRIVTDGVTLLNQVR